VHGVDQRAVIALVTEPLSWRFVARVNRNNMFFYPRALVLRELKALDPRVANVKLAFDGRHRLHVIASGIYSFAALLHAGRKYSCLSRCIERSQLTERLLFCR